MKTEAQDRHGHERHGVQHDGRGGRGDPAAAPKNCGRPRTDTSCETAHAARRRHRHAHDQEHAPPGTSPTNGKRQIERPRRKPDAEARWTARRRTDRHERRDQRRPGGASRPGPRRTCARSCVDDASRIRAGSTRVSRPAQRPSRSGWPAPTRSDAERQRSRPRPSRCPRPSHVAARRRSRSSASNSETAAARSTRSSTRSMITVANVAAALKPSRARQQVRPQHLAEPAGQQERRRESDDRRPERVAKRRVADRQQQRLPAPGAEHVRRRPSTRPPRRAGEDRRASIARQTSPTSRLWKNHQSNADASRRRSSRACQGKRERATAIGHERGRTGSYYKIGGKSMGKRELLIIVAFVALGAVAYELTRRRRKTASRGFSLSRLFRRGAQRACGPT